MVGTTDEQRERERRAAAIRPLFQTLKAQGRTHRWLTGQLGISHTALWNYERGERRPPPGTIERICQALGVKSAALGINPSELEREAVHPRRAAAIARAKQATQGSVQHGTSTPHPSHPPYEPRAAACAGTATPTPPARRRQSQTSQRHAQPA